MRRLLICILVFNSFFAGMSYAWDADPAAYLGHEAVDVNAPADERLPGDEVEHTDDHCCHGDAHLVVLLDETQAAEPYPAGDTLRPLSPVSFRQLHVAPLLRPPIV